MATTFTASPARSAGPHLRPVTSDTGTVVEGVDLARPLDPADLSAMAAALHERGVIVVPGPVLGAPALREAVTQFAPLRPGNFGGSERSADDIASDFGKQRRFTAIWHADGTFAAEPAKFTALQAVRLPEVGGDTCFSNMYSAWDALSAPLRAMLSGLSAIHSVDPVVRRLGPLGKAYGERAAAEHGAEHAHPVARVHPDTGRTALYVNSSWTTRIEGLEEDESDALLAFLFAHVKRPEFQMRWRWSEGDLVIWDNRCVQHYAVPDYEGERIMQRVDTEGERPVGPA